MIEFVSLGLEIYERRGYFIPPSCIAEERKIGVIIELIPNFLS